ncbi:MAG: redoxin domain-containing protein [Sphingopyxis sp.]
MIRRFIAFTLSAAILATAPVSSASATLASGARAPMFTLPAAQGGRRLTINLQRLLRSGPVVIYFFPRAFTEGCTIESRAFAEAVPLFRRARTNVIGISGDDIETLGRFSTEACRATFPMVSANADLMAQYEVALRPGVSNRTSYIITMNGTIAQVHNDMNPNDHVRTMLAAARALDDARRD